MIKFELRKLFRQQRLTNCLLLLLLLMIRSLEISIYARNQHLTKGINDFRDYLTIYQATTPTDTKESQIQLQLRRDAYNALKADDGHQAQVLANKTMNLRSPWLNYSGDFLMTNLHAGEVEATRKELQYIKKYQLSGIMPLTILTNPKTETTNSLSNDGLSNFSDLTKRYYTKGFEQIWFWAKTAGIFILLTIINIFFGDIFSMEWDHKTNYISWLNLNGVKTSKIIVSKFLIHFLSSVVLLSVATMLFLIYAKFRSGLGSLQYPVQNWQIGSNIKTHYFWLTANDDANYFAPFQIMFKPLSDYLLKFTFFTIALVLLNSALTILVNYVVRNKIASVIIMALLPLSYFVFSADIKTPVRFLNFDWLTTGYLNYLNRTTTPLFNEVILILVLGAVVLLTISLLWNLRTERKRYGR